MVDYFKDLTNDLASSRERDLQVTLKQKENDLEDRGKLLSRTKVAIHQLQQDLTQARAAEQTTREEAHQALDEQERRLTDLEQQLQQSQQEAQALRDVLAEHTQQQVSRQEQKLQGALEDWAAELTQAQTEIQAQALNIAQDRSELGARHHKAAIMAAENEDLQEARAAAEIRVRGVAEEVAACRAEAHGLQSTQGELKKGLIQAEQARKEAEAKLVVERAELEKRAAKNDRLVQELAANKAALAAYEDQLKDSSSKLTAAKEYIWDVQEECDDAKRLLQAADQRAARLEADCAASADALQEQTEARIVSIIERLTVLLCREACREAKRGALARALEDAIAMAAQEGERRRVTEQALHDATARHREQAAAKDAQLAAMRSMMRGLQEDVEHATAAWRRRSPDRLDEWQDATDVPCVTHFSIPSCRRIYASAA